MSHVKFRRYLDDTMASANSHVTDLIVCTPSLMASYTFS